jgi:heme/copper-type cytochrome/quinol oxidase subunit 1
LSGIPRRYSDYSDFLSLWNIISSIGAFIAITRLLFLRWIILEAFLSQRHILRRSVIPSIVEWNISYPVVNHCFFQNVIFRKRNK